MTREQVRALAAKVLDAPCPADDVRIDLTSLQQLEFFLALEDAIEYRVDIHEDVGWKCIADVLSWLEDNGELQEP